MQKLSFFSPSTFANWLLLNSDIVVLPYLSNGIEKYPMTSASSVWNVRKRLNPSPYLDKNLMLNSDAWKRNSSSGISSTNLFHCGSKKDTLETLIWLVENKKSNLLSHATQHTLSKSNLPKCWISNCCKVINSQSTLQTSNKLKVASYSIWSIVCVDGIMIVDREAPSHRTWSYERSHDVYLRSHRSYVRSHYVYLRSHLVYHALIRYIYALIWVMYALIRPMHALIWLSMLSFDIFTLSLGQFTLSLC